VYSPLAPISVPSGLRITTRTLPAHAEVDFGLRCLPIGALLDVEEFACLAEAKVVIGD
jgi:hypothetical protein